MNSNDKLKKENEQSLKILLAILIVIVFIAGGTFAYMAFSRTSQNITGNAGNIDLQLNVTKVSPVGISDAETGYDNLIVINYNNLPAALNSSCIDSSGDAALCQVYEISLSNNSTSVNTSVKGSVLFHNANTPNLAWIILDEATYTSTTTYTSDNIPSTFTYSSTDYTLFDSSYLLNKGSTKKYYLVLFVEGSQVLGVNNGTFSGEIKFEDTNGKGVTSTFS